VSDYQRPWWLLVNKPAGLVTTIKEETGPDKRGFVIHGEPLVQGLAWLTWGPAAALVVVLILTGLAIGLNIREQAGMVRLLFVAAFLLLPALAWGIATILANRLAARHLEAERRAEAQDCFIYLNRARGELSFRVNALAENQQVPFGQIHQVRVTPALGVRDGRSLCLTLDTDRGKIILLNETLGTESQKIDLAREIQMTVSSFKTQ
jgi:hypothetical protein